MKKRLLSRKWNRRLSQKENLADKRLLSMGYTYGADPEEATK